MPPTMPPISAGVSALDDFEGGGGAVDMIVAVDAAGSAVEVIVAVDTAGGAVVMMLDVDVDDVGVVVEELVLSSVQHSSREYCC
jgi:hypothetical protein